MLTARQIWIELAAIIRVLVTRLLCIRSRDIIVCNIGYRYIVITVEVFLYRLTQLETASDHSDAEQVYVTFKIYPLVGYSIQSLAYELVFIDN